MGGRRNPAHLNADWRRIKHLCTLHLHLILLLLLNQLHVVHLRWLGLPLLYLWLLLLGQVDNAIEGGYELLLLFLVLLKLLLVLLSMSITLWLLKLLLLLVEHLLIVELGRSHYLVWRGLL